MTIALRGVLAPNMLPTGMGSFMEGLQNESARRQKMKQEALQNQMLQQQVQMAPEKEQSLLANQLAQRNLMGAQQQYYQNRGQGGVDNLTGPAAQAASLAAYIKEVGPSSPEGIRAQKAWDATFGEKSARGQYYKTNVWLKNLSPLAKTQFFNNFQKTNAVRQSRGLGPLTPQQFAGQQGLYSPNITSGMAGSQSPSLGTPVVGGAQVSQPVSQQAAVQSQQQPAHQMQQPDINPYPSQSPQQAISPEDFASEATQTQQSAIKQTTDSENRQKIRYGLLAENTLRNMINDASAMYNYSGPMGRIKLANDAAMSSKGNKVPMYEKYQRYLTNARMAGSQINQYLGQSIRPEMREEINELTNPSTILNNPRVAQQKLNAFLTSFSQELNKRVTANTDPATYTKQSPQMSAPEVSGSDPTQADLEFTAKKYNMTVDQVKQKLGMK